jgi:hypothetical protein
MGGLSYISEKYSSYLDVGSGVWLQDPSHHPQQHRTSADSAELSEFASIMRSTAPFIHNMVLNDPRLNMNSISRPSPFPPFLNLRQENNHVQQPPFLFS